MVHVFLPVDPSLAVCGCGRWFRQLDRMPHTAVERSKSIRQLAELWREHWLEVFQPEGTDDADS